MRQLIAQRVELNGSSGVTPFEFGGVLAGGCFVSVLSDVFIKDFDIFFPSVDQRKAYLKAANFRHINPNTKKNIKLQQYELIALHDFKTTEELLETFDISVCRIAYDGSQFYFGETALQDIEDKRLRLLKVTNYLEVTLTRIIKYIQKGFNPEVADFGVICKDMKAGFPNILFKGYDPAPPQPVAFWADADMFRDAAGNWVNFPVQGLEQPHRGNPQPDIFDRIF